MLFEIKLGITSNDSERSEECILNTIIHKQFIMIKPSFHDYSSVKTAVSNMLILNYRRCGAYIFMYDNASSHRIQLTDCILHEQHIFTKLT